MLEASTPNSEVLSFYPVPCRELRIRGIEVDLGPTITHELSHRRYRVRECDGEAVPRRSRPQRWRKRQFVRVSLVSTDAAARDQHGTIGGGYSETGGIKFAVSEQRRELAASISPGDIEITAKLSFPFAPAARVREESSYQKRMIFRARQGRVFLDVNASFENVEQATCFTRDQCRGIASAEGKGCTVRRATSPRCCYLEAGASLSGVGQFEVHQVLAGHKNGSDVECTPPQCGEGQA